MMVELSKLRITFLAGTLGQGGAELQLFHMVRALQRVGASVRLLCLTQGEFWEHRFRALGVPVTWVGSSRSRLGRLASIIAALREHPADILQSQHFYTNLYVVLAARTLGMRDVGAIRSNGTGEVLANGPLLGRLSLRAPRVIAANSQTAIHNALGFGISSKRLFLLPNVVDPETFKPMTKVENGSVRLLAAGRLSEEKRFDRFLKLVARLHCLSPLPVRAVVVGDGQKRQALERRAADLQLRNGILEFRSAVPEMSEVYKNADIFVLTSDREGSPNVVLEAMASALPVVAMGVGGVPDLLRDGETGFVIAPGDEESLTQRALWLIGDASARRRIGARARDYVIANHSPDELPARLAGVYEAALS